MSEQSHGPGSVTRRSAAVVDMTATHAEMLLNSTPESIVTRVILKDIGAKALGEHVVPVGRYATISEDGTIQTHFINLAPDDAGTRIKPGGSLAEDLGLAEQIAAEKQSEHTGLSNVLETFKQEIALGSQDPELIRKSYDLSRAIADGILTSGNKSGEVAAVLSATRDFARPLETHYEVSPGTQGGHRQQTRELFVNPETIFNVGKFEADVKASKVELRPGDAKLLSLLTVMAHETGHALLSGVSNTRAPQDAGEKHLAATRSYLKRNPQLGFTGNWDNDVAIHEERFAEGYAMLVVDKVVATLGYSKRDAAKIKQALSAGTELRGAKGKNQLDHLKHVDADNSLHALVGEPQAGILDQSYDGNLGYGKPLTANEMIDQLVEHNSQLTNGGQLDNGNDPKTWFTAVRSRQHRKIKQHLKKTVRERKDTLNPRRASTRYAAKLVLGSIIAGSALGVAAGHEINEYRSAHQIVHHQTSAPDPSKISLNR